VPPHLEYVSKGLANIRQRPLRRDCALPAITRRDNYRADRTAIAGSTFREKAFSSYSAGRPRLGCARGQPRTGPDRLRARRPAARRAGTLTPGASRSSRAACHLSPGPGGPAFWSARTTPSRSDPDIRGSPRSGPGFRVDLCLRTSEQAKYPPFGTGMVSRVRHAGAVQIGLICAKPIPSQIRPSAMPNRQGGASSVVSSVQVPAGPTAEPRGRRRCNSWP